MQKQIMNFIARDVKCLEMGCLYMHMLIGSIFLVYLDQHYTVEKYPKSIRAGQPYMDYYDKAVAYHLDIVDAIKSGNINKAEDIIKQLTHMS